MFGTKVHNVDLGSAQYSHYTYNLCMVNTCVQHKLDTGNYANILVFVFHFRLEGIVCEYRQALKSSESEKEKLHLEIKNLQVRLR